MGSKRGLTALGAHQAGEGGGGGSATAKTFYGFKGPLFDFTTETLFE